MYIVRIKIYLIESASIRQKLKYKCPGTCEVNIGSVSIGLPHIVEESA